ncbi:MAG: HAD hydrolase-like protein [Dehalococcoidia bacterium]
MRCGRWRRCGVEPHEVPMVGDAGADIGAAHAAGTLSAAALWGAQASPRCALYGRRTN